MRNLCSLILYITETIVYLKTDIKVSLQPYKPQYCCIILELRSSWLILIPKFQRLSEKPNV